MKKVRTTKDYQVFHLLPQEKQLLLEILKLYPVIPESHASLSKTGDLEAWAEQEALLREALAEQRQHHQQQLQSLLNDPQWFTRCANGYRFTLNQAQLEWLLQILNDIRIGSWLKLGAPEDYDRRKIAITEQNARYVMAMDLCGIFQSALMDDTV
jgi:hypothetical protein